MTEWWDRYLENVSKEELISLLTDERFADPLYMQRWIFEQAALCRLSFASIIDMVEGELGYGVPKEAIINRTQIGLSKGRPQTARWAFWTGYLLKQACSQEKHLSSEFSAILIGILLGTEVRPAKVRTIFPELDREAEKHAINAARLFQENTLKPGLNEKQFKKDFTSYLSEYLLPDTSMPPMVENGKLNENWVEGVLNARKTILRKIRKHDFLCGQRPIIRISVLTRLAVNIPLNPLNSPPILSSDEDGKIHLEKSKDISVPIPVLKKENSMSFNFSPNQVGGGTTSIGFPQNSLCERDPYVAALFAVPGWWFKWHTNFIASLK